MFTCRYLGRSQNRPEDELSCCIKIDHLCSKLSRTFLSHLAGAAACANAAVQSAVPRVPRRAQLWGPLAEAFMDLEKPFQSRTACGVLLIKIQDKPLVHLDSIFFLWSWFSRLDQGQT